MKKQAKSCSGIQFIEIVFQFRQKTLVSTIQKALPEPEKIVSLSDARPKGSLAQLQNSESPD